MPNVVFRSGRVGAPSSNRLTAAQTVAPNLLLTVALLYAPFFAGAGKILEIPRDTLALISLSTCGLIAWWLYLTARRNSRGRVRTFSPVSVSLIVFCVSMVFSSFLEYMTGVRTDSAAMWRQLIMGLFPLVLYFGCQEIARTTDVAVGVERGVLALAALSAASIVLEFLGVIQYEHFGSRYFGFLSDGSAWLVAIVCVVFFSQQKFIALGFMLFVLALTGSRGATLILIASILLLIMTGRLGFRKKMVGSVIVIGLAGFAAAVFGVGHFDTLLERTSGVNFYLKFRSSK